MNFPVYSPEQAQVLPDIVNIMLACCLAMYPESSKKPVLQLRVKLMATVHTLKARGSPMDLYTFCTSNMSLLRIAMIEYFVYFISSFMPNETSMLTTVFGLQQDIADIFRQFTIICDTFRHQSMQDHVLDLADVNLKAQVAIGTLARSVSSLSLCVLSLAPSRSPSSFHRCPLGVYASSTASLGIYASSTAVPSVYMRVAPLSPRCICEFHRCPLGVYASSTAVPRYTCEFHRCPSV